MLKFFDACKQANTIHIKPTVLFMRCNALAQRQSEELMPYFVHELSVIPISLFNMFKDDLMRRTKKSELERVFKKDLSNLCNRVNHDHQDHMKVIW